VNSVFAGVRVVDALYRVSTRAQENEGDSLYNQAKAINDWAFANEVTVRHTIRVAESGKSALQLRDGAFRFSRRKEYGKLIQSYEKGVDLPDAVCVDWMDRWSRDPHEFLTLIKTLRSCGIRLLSIGDAEDLTDPRNALLATVKSAVAAEQLRVTSDKVRESRRSRRERARWQGGRVPDGYRTHTPECAGRSHVTRQDPDGVERAFTVRSCSCPADVLHRDPAREATIIAIWEMLARSPLSWQAMADALNEAGHRRRSGGLFVWNDIHRIGENPHYAGVMVSDRWEEHRDVGRFARLNPLERASLRPSEGAIVDPYVSEEEFWRIHELRFRGERRHLRRSKRGGSNELIGIVVCPGCNVLMTSSYSLSSKVNGNGRPRKAPRKRYAYLVCAQAKKDPSACVVGRKWFLVETLGKALVEHLATTAAMSDTAIMKALQLHEPSKPRKALQREHAQLEAQITEADVTRRFLQRERALERITDDEYQRDLFDLRRAAERARHRLEDVRRQLGSTHARPSFSSVRSTVTWLAENWASLTSPERAEALRLLVTRVTIGPNGKPKVLEYGPGFVEPSTKVRLGAVG
jgi:DNA invertase Pin-like site-specific DNA recombinase